MQDERKRELLDRAIQHFNRRRFFECHEVLEEIWLQEPPAQKPFYQGIIQIAAAFHHFKRGNLRGALSLMQAGAEKLRDYPANHEGVQLAGLLAGLSPWLERLQSGSPFEAPEFPALHRAG